MFNFFLKGWKLKSEILCYWLGQESNTWGKIDVNIKMRVYCIRAKKFHIKFEDFTFFGLSLNYPWSSGLLTLANNVWAWQWSIKVVLLDLGAKHWQKLNISNISFMTQINFYIYCLVLTHNELHLKDMDLADFTLNKTYHKKINVCCKYFTRRI